MDRKCKEGGRSSEGRSERNRGGGSKEQKVQDGEWGSDGRQSPTSAVTTTRLAAVAADCDCCSNKADSCHKHHLLNMTHMYAHLWTHTHTHTY